MSAQHTPAWLDHAAQVGIASEVPGVFRLRDEAERLVARLKKCGAPAASVHHFHPDNFAVIQRGDGEKRDVLLVQAHIDAAIAKAGREA